jgi:hypothetical protein
MILVQYSLGHNLFLGIWLINLLSSTCRRSPACPDCRQAGGWQV